MITTSELIKRIKNSDECILYAKEDGMLDVSFDWTDDEITLTIGSGFGQIHLTLTFDKFLSSYKNTRWKLKR